MPRNQSPIDRYVDELFRWNRRVRLTGVRTPEEFRREMLPAVEQSLDLIAPHAWDFAVDIGSGNGLVAIPVAVALPQRPIVALEPNRRKCSFLGHIKQSLALSNLVVAPQRLEEYVLSLQNKRLLWMIRASEIGAETFSATLAQRRDDLLLAIYCPHSPLSEVLDKHPRLFKTLQKVEIQQGKDRAQLVALCRIDGPAGARPDGPEPARV